MVETVDRYTHNEADLDHICASVWAANLAGQALARESHIGWNDDYDVYDDDDPCTILYGDAYAVIETLTNLGVIDWERLADLYRQAHVATSPPNL